MVPRLRSCVLWALSPGVSQAEAAVPRLQGRCQEWRPQAALPLDDDQEGYEIFGGSFYFLIKIFQKLFQVM